MPQPAPTKIVDAFGHAAGPSYITPQIPETTTTAGAASFSQGFPPVTMTAPAAGGVPPFGQDMNGILNQITAGLAALQAGQLPVFDAVYCAAIGGYGLGALLAMADGTGLWINTAGAMNTTNPDAVGALGWYAVYSQGLGVINGLTAGTVALPIAQSKKQIVYFTGTLTGNVVIVFPANAGQQWLVANCTTGGFTLTVLPNTGGSGVVIPQGAFASPTGIYSDGTNLYPTVAPLGVPISQAATPLTLVERTNNGYVLANYFNQASGLEVPAIGAVFVQNTAADGFLRKISPAAFLSQLLPAVVVAPTPSTLVERSPSGYVYGTYMNQSSPLENVTPDAIFVEVNSDGFFRKLSPMNFINALGLALQTSVATVAAGLASLMATVAGLPKVQSGTFACAAGTVAVAFPAAFTTIPKVAYGFNYANPDVGWIVPGSITVNGFSFQNGNAGTVDYIAVGT